MSSSLSSKGLDDFLNNKKQKSREKTGKGENGTSQTGNSAAQETKRPGDQSPKAADNSVTRGEKESTPEVSREKGLEQPRELDSQVVNDQRSKGGNDHPPQGAQEQAPQHPEDNNPEGARDSGSIGARSTDPEEARETGRRRADNQTTEFPKDHGTGGAEKQRCREPGDTAPLPHGDSPPLQPEAGGSQGHADTLPISHSDQIDEFLYSGSSNKRDHHFYINELLSDELEESHFRLKRMFGREKRTEITYSIIAEIAIATVLTDFKSNKSNSHLYRIVEKRLQGKGVESDSNKNTSRQ